MIEPLYRSENMAAQPSIEDVSPDALQRARDRVLLWRATTLAIESAFTFGKDLPVGAVAASGNFIVGRYFSSDRRSGYNQMHAEYMAVMDSRLDPNRPKADTVVVTVEPCENCQDFLAQQANIKRVGFGFVRKELVAMNLVKPHEETIFQRAIRVGLPYEIVQIYDTQLAHAGRLLLSHVKRDTNNELIEIDRSGLRESLINLND